MNLASLLEILLSNIEKVDINVIDEILEYLPKTQVAYFVDLFKFIKDYYDNQKEMPSADYLVTNANGMYSKTESPLDRETLKILLFELKKESTINEAIIALQKGDIESANIITSQGLVSCDFTETKITDTYATYNERASLPEGIVTGISELDRAYKNFSYGTNNIIAAPQKAGKTTAALSIAYDACMKKGMNVIYLTLEVQPYDISCNILARHAYELGKKLNAQKAKKNLLDPEELGVLAEVQTDFEQRLREVGGNFSVIANHDLPEFNFTYLQQLFEKKYEEWGSIDLVVIDHIGLTGFYKMKGVSDLKERINTWIRWTTDMCKGFKEHGFILVTLMQINRQGTALLKKGKAPGFDSLADANESERSAHTITVIYSNPEMLMSNSIKVYCLANRNGPAMIGDSEDGSVDAYLNPATFVLGHRKYGDTISLKNKDLLKSATLPTATSLFSNMVGS